MRDTNLQNCFLSVRNGRVIVIAISLNIDFDKSIMEIKQLQVKPTSVLPAEYLFEFPCVVKIFTASFLPDVHNPEVIVLYHDNITNSCCVTRIHPVQLT